MYVHRYQHGLVDTTFQDIDRQAAMVVYVHVCVYACACMCIYYIDICTHKSIRASRYHVFGYLIVNLQCVCVFVYKLYMYVIDIYVCAQMDIN